MKYFVLVAVMLALPPPSFGASDDEFEQYEKLGAWVHDAFPIHFPTSQRSIEELGPIVTIDYLGVQSSSAGEPMIDRKFVFDGLTIQALVDQSDAQKAFVYLIHITSPAWPIANGLSVGMPEDELGKVEFQPNDGAHGYCGMGDNCIKFETKDGYISAIKIYLYIG